MCHILDYIVATKEGRDPNKELRLLPEGAPMTWSGTHIVFAAFQDKRVYGPKDLAIKTSGELILYPDRAPIFLKAE